MVSIYTNKNQKKAVDQEFRIIIKRVDKEVKPIKKMKSKKIKFFGQLTEGLGESFGVKRKKRRRNR